MKSPAQRIAKAITEVCPHAGQAHNADQPQHPRTRAANLLREGPYGAYIVDGDPNDWGDGEAVATIYMEQHGGPDDCNVPIDYYRQGDGYFAIDVAVEASRRCGLLIEFCNAAVACAYKD